MSLDPDEVRAAAAAWLYVPPDAVEVRRERFRLLAYPLTWSCPTVVTSIEGADDAAGLVDEALIAARDLGRAPVWFWTRPGAGPPDLVEHLLARGAVVDEELAVLARPLSEGGLPDLAVPADVEVRTADDLATIRDHDRVGVAVFGGGELDDDALRAELARAAPGVGIPVVAYRAGEPVGAAGWTVAGEVARLWGGSVLEPARGAGVYRALLDHRLRAAVEQGCRVALVKGRLTTSAPVLRRAGFGVHGSETSYRLG